MAITITPQDIAARVNGFQLTDNSTPSIDTILQMIQEDTAYVLMLVRSKGVVVTAGSEQEVYLRGLVIRLVVAKAELARNRSSSTFATEVQDRAIAELNAFLERAANLTPSDVGHTDKPASGNQAVNCKRRLNEIDRWRAQGKL